MKIRSWFFLVLLTSCQPRWAHSQEPRIPIDGLFAKFCDALLLQDSEAGQVRVVVGPEARPIYQTFALRALKGVPPLDPKVAEEDDRRDRERVTEFRRTLFDLVQQNSDCMFELRVGSEAETSKDGEVHLALSPIIPDPVAADPNEQTFGLFAKLSLEGAGPSWFWVKLERAGVRWKAVAVHELPISE
jgi:hypothetical protein